MAKARTAIDREGWIAVFEAAATRKGDEVNDEWRWLLEELGMTADSYPALVEALGQGRWRDAKDPRAYVKTVAKREALREEIREKRNDILTIIPSSAGHPEFSVEGALDTLSYARKPPKGSRVQTVFGAQVGPESGHTPSTTMRTTTASQFLCAEGSEQNCLKVFRNQAQRPRMKRIWKRSTGDTSRSG